MPDCKPCSDGGMTVPAMYVVNGVPMCEPCRRNKIEAPKEKKTEEKKGMNKEIDWVKIQNRRSSGENVEDMAKELGVTGATIYNHTKPNGTVRVSPKVKRQPKVQDVAASNGRYGRILADLTSERDGLNAAIAAIEKLL